jgi:sugar lactone lactonase YvrE
MERSIGFTRAAVIGVAAAAFCGCAGLQSVRPAAVGTGAPAVPRYKAPPGHPLALAVRSQRFIYVADDGYGQIVIFPEAGKLRSPIGTISTGINGPYGLYVDRHGALYVANSGSSTVTVYPKGATSPSLTFTKDLDRPLYPVLDGRGDLFAGNANGGTVVEYLASGAKGFNILQTPGVEVDGMAFDRSGTLYTAYRDRYGQGSVEAFAAGATKGRVIGMSLDQPQGVVVDSHYKVLVAETGGGGTNRIDVFPPGATKASSEVQLPGDDTPTQIVLENNEKALFVSALSGTIYEMPYPLPQRPYVKERLSTLVQGVTVSNDQTF